MNRTFNNISDPLSVPSMLVPLNIIRMNERQNTMSPRSVSELSIQKKTQNADVCCVCTKQSGKFMPIQCFYYRSESNSHKICQDCWWDEEKGFAIESKSHKCPGCVEERRNLNNMSR